MAEVRQWRHGISPLGRAACFSHVEHRKFKLRFRDARRKLLPVMPAATVHITNTYLPKCFRLAPHCPPHSQPQQQPTEEPAEVQGILKKAS